jgi:hypothetical protein
LLKNCWEKLSQHVKALTSGFNNREREKKIVEKNKREKKTDFEKNKLIDLLRREKKCTKQDIN